MVEATGPETDAWVIDDHAYPEPIDIPGDEDADDGAVPAGGERLEDRYGDEAEDGSGLEDRYADDELYGPDDPVVVGTADRDDLDAPGQADPVGGPVRAESAHPALEADEINDGVPSARSSAAAQRSRPARAKSRTGPARPRPGPRRNPPVVRLGLLWTLALVVAIALSPVLAAVVLAPAAGVAALTAWRCMETPVVEPWWLAAACGGIPPVVALAGLIPAVVALVAGTVALVMITARDAPRHDQVRVAICALDPAAAAASVILACQQSVTIGLGLVAAVCLFDASNHVMGVGETGGRLGAVSGLLSLGVLSVLLAGVLVVPFSGASPWLLCGMTAVAAPVSVGAAHRLVGSVRLPAWRRLDSLFIAGPAWVIMTRLLLHH